SSRRKRKEVRNVLRHSVRIWRMAKSTSANGPHINPNPRRRYRNDGTMEEMVGAHRDNHVYEFYMCYRSRVVGPGGLAANCYTDRARNSRYWRESHLRQYIWRLQTGDRRDYR